VHQDGLVHVSQLSDQFVKEPSEVVKVAQRVNVTVMEVDLPRKRIALSMKAAPQLGATSVRSQGGPSRVAQPPKPKSVTSDWFTEALNRK